MLPTIRVLLTIMPLLLIDRFLEQNGSGYVFAKKLHIVYFRSRDSILCCGKIETGAPKITPPKQNMLSLRNKIEDEYKTAQGSTLFNEEEKQRIFDKLREKEAELARQIALRTAFMELLSEMSSYSQKISTSLGNISSLASTINIQVYRDTDQGTPAGSYSWFSSDQCLCKKPSRLGRDGVRIYIEPEEFVDVYYQIVSADAVETGL